MRRSQTTRSARPPRRWPRKSSVPISQVAKPTPDSAQAAPWHAAAPSAVLSRLDTQEEGLSTEEALSRAARYGANTLPVAEGPSPAALLLRQIRSPLLYALLASAAVAFAFGEAEDGAVVLAVVVLNALIGFVQELRAGRAI